MDKHHNQCVATVSDLRLPEDSVARAEIDFTGVENEKEYEGYETLRFSFDQLLKSAGLTKGKVKALREEGEDAEQHILDEVEGEEFLFKYGNDMVIYGIVSPKFQSIPTEQVHDLITQEIARHGLSPEDYHNGFIGSAEIRSRVEYNLGHNTEVEGVGDTISASIVLKNSVFGAEALKITKKYEILACENGMCLPESEQVFRQVHMGDRQEIEERITEVVSQLIEDMWDETDFIKKVDGISFPVEEQVEWLESLVEEDKLTKKAAENITEIIEEGEYNSGEDSVWSLINAFTGRAEHQEVSRSEMNKLESVYTQLLQVEDKDEVLALAE